MRSKQVRARVIVTIRQIGTAVVAVLTVVVAVWLAALPDVSAQATTESSNANSLKVSPLRSDLTIRPGETRKVPVYVQNITTAPITLKPILNDFTASPDEDGAPNILLDENQFAPTRSLKRYMQPLENIVVQPGERKEVNVTIAMPADVGSGGYFGALRFAPVSADGSENLSVSGSVASLILVTVPGNLVENLELTNFDLQQNGKVVSRLSSGKDVSMLVRLKNNGNVQVAPFGSVFVQKGDKVLYSAKINDVKPAGVILPDSARKWDLPLEKIGGFGKYKIIASFGYGGSGETINMEKTVWVIPTMYIIAALVALLVLILLVVAVVLGLRAYKRRILRRARRR